MLAEIVGNYIITHKKYQNASREIGLHRGLTKGIEMEDVRQGAVAAAGDVGWRDHGNSTGGGDPVAGGLPSAESRAPEVLAPSSRTGQPPSLVKHWVKITIYHLPVDGCVYIGLRGDGAAAWAMGDSDTDFVGVALETPTRNTVLKLRNFVINDRELTMRSHAACDEIRITLWVKCADNAIRGYVDLPLGANITIESEVDRTSLWGLSSFSLTFS